MLALFDMLIALKSMAPTLECLTLVRWAMDYLSCGSRLLKELHACSFALWLNGRL